MNFEELEFFHKSGLLLVEPDFVLNIIAIQRCTSIEMLRYLRLILLVSATSRVVISVVKTRITEVRLDRQPVTASVIHNNEFLLWGANI